MKYFLVTTAVSIAFMSIACGYTEVIVEDGLVKVSTTAGEKLVHPGQKASFKFGQSPDVKIDDPIVDDAIALYKIAKQERQTSDIDYTLTSIQSFVLENNGKAHGAFAVQFPTNITSDICILGETIITDEQRYYSLEGELLDYQIDQIAPYRGYYYVNFPEPVPAGKSFEFISTFEFDIKPLTLKKDNYYELTAGEGTPNCLAYYRIVLPKGAEFLECTGNVDLIKIDSHYAKVGLTIKGRKGSSGSHYTIKYTLDDKFLEEPDDDAFDMNEAINADRALQEETKEIMSRSGGDLLKVYEFIKKQKFQWPKRLQKLGIRLVDAGYFGEALECFKKTTDNLNRYENPYGICAIAWHGHLLDMAGKRDQAIEKYNLVLKILEKYERGPTRHDQWGIVLNRKWFRDRLEIPFTQEMLKKDNKNIKYGYYAIYCYGTK